MTMQCWIHILTVHFEEDKRTGGKAKRSFMKMYHRLSFEWNLNQRILHWFTSCSVGQSFCSRSVGHLFWLQMMPNGYTTDTKGIVKLYLESVGGLPSGLRAIKLKYDIECTAMHFRKSDTVKIKKRGYSAIANFNFGKLKQLRKHCHLTLKCQLTVESAYDVNKQSINKSVWTKHGILMHHLQVMEGASTPEIQTELSTMNMTEDEKVKEDPERGTEPSLPITTEQDHRENVKNTDFVQSQNGKMEQKEAEHTVSKDVSIETATALTVRDIEHIENDKTSDEMNESKASRTRSGGILLDDEVVMKQMTEQKESEKKEIEDAVHRLIPGFFEVKARESKSLLSDHPPSDSGASNSSDDHNVDIESVSILKQNGARKTNQSLPDSPSYPPTDDLQKEEERKQEVDADDGNADDNTTGNQISRFNVIHNTDDDGVDNEDILEENAHSQSSHLEQKEESFASQSLDDRQRSTVEIVNIEESLTGNSTQNKDNGGLTVSEQSTEADRSFLGRFVIEAARSGSVLSNVSTQSHSQSTSYLYDPTSPLSSPPIPLPNTNTNTMPASQRPSFRTKSKSASESPLSLGDMDSNDVALGSRGQRPSGPVPPLMVTNKSHTPGALMMAGNSNTVSPNMASPLYVTNGRFCVRTASGVSIDSVMTNQSYNELKESVDKIDERIYKTESALKEMQSRRESDTIRWTERFNKLSQTVETLAKSVDDIKRVQLNMLLMMESRGDAKDIAIAADGKTDALRRWLCDTLHLEEYFDLFVEEGFDDVSLLVHLEEEDLIKLNIRKMAHRKKLLHAIQSLRHCFVPENQRFHVLNGYRSSHSRRRSDSSTIEHNDEMMAKHMGNIFVGSIVGGIVDENDRVAEKSEQVFVE